MEKVRALLGSGELRASCVPGGQHHLDAMKSSTGPPLELRAQMGRGRRDMAMRIRNLRHPCTIIIVDPRPVAA